MKILYVEDHAMLAEVTLDILNMTRPGLKGSVIHAATYADAVRALEEQAFDLVISDYIYPGKADANGRSRSSLGGVDLYNYLVEEGRLEGFALLSAEDPYTIERVAQERGAELKRLCIFFKPTPLAQIIDVYENKRDAFSVPKKRPSQKFHQPQSSSQPRF